MRPLPEENEPTSSSGGDSARFYGTIPLLVALVLIIAAEGGLTRVLNGLLFDVATRQLDPKEPRVVLFEPGPSTAAAHVDWAAAVTRLQHLGAEKIVFTFDAFSRGPPAELTSELIVAQEPAPVPGKPGQWRLEERRSSRWLRSGAGIIPPSEHGVFRRQRLWIPSPEGRVPTIEALAADRPLNAPPDFLIGIPASEVLPRISMEQLFSDAFPERVLSGKIAVLGAGRSVDSPRYGTPGAGTNGQVNKAEFHARAIQSLLSGRAIQPLGGAWRAILLLVSSLLLVRVLSRFESSAFVRNGAAILTLTLAVGFASLEILDLMLPLTELLIAELVLGFIIYRHKETLQEERLAAMVERASSYIARHALLKDLNRWPEFLATAARSAGIEHWLLFEELEGRTEILGTHGTLTETVTGNIGHSPLLQQADKSQPWPVEAGEIIAAPGQQAHLVRIGDTERRFYWLYAIATEDPNAARTATAARRLSRRLIEAVELELGSRTAKRHSHRFKTLGDQVAHSMDLIVSRSTELRQSLAAMQTAMILYDAAGMPLQTNTSMRSLFRKLRLDVADATPVDLTERLTSMDADAARAVVKELVLNGGEMRVAAAQEVEGRRFVLRATHVQSEDGELTGGLLFEAIDVTEVERLAQVQRELASQVDSQIRNDLEAIQLAARLASDTRLSADRQAKALALVVEATARARVSLSSVGELLDRALRVGMPDPYPVNPKSALMRAISCVRATANELGVELKLDQPELTTAVVAEAALLDDAVEAMVRVALNDSPRGSSVTAELLEYERESEILVSGGFGLTNERMQEILCGKGQGGPEEFRVIAQAREVFPSWGGCVEASSVPGAGYSFRIRLRKV